MTFHAVPPAEPCFHTLNATQTSRGSQRDFQRVTPHTHEHLEARACRITPPSSLCIMRLNAKQFAEPRTSHDAHGLPGTAAKNARALRSYTLVPYCMPQA